MRKEKTVVLGVTASIAIYKSCDVVRRLKEKQYNVLVVMTQEAQGLIRPVVFQSLSGNKVYKGLFEEPDAGEIEHVSLADQANLVLIAPATANIIGKLASGIYDDLLTCVVCATTAPVLICPAMNEKMYYNAIVQDNIKKLKAAGYKFLGPVKGRLACGKSGKGCLASVDLIVKEAEKYL